MGNSDNEPHALGLNSASGVEGLDVQEGLTMEGLLCTVVGRIRAECCFEDGVPKTTTATASDAASETGKFCLKGQGGCLQEIVDEREDVIAGISLPILSLQHTERSDDQTRSDRNKVEEFASTLLARRLLYSRDKDTSKEVVDAEDKRDATIIVASEDGSNKRADLLPLQILQNLTESFATLVACRLRAYATFLARHGIALAGNKTDEDSDVGVLVVEQKLNKLLEIGGNINARSLQMSFERTNSDEEDIMMDDKEEDLEGQMPTNEIPISLNVRMEVEVPNPVGDNKIIPLSMSAKGKAKGTFAFEHKPSCVYCYCFCNLFTPFVTLSPRFS